jgi:homoserine O-succinyltransferase
MGLGRPDGKSISIRQWERQPFLAQRWMMMTSTYVSGPASMTMPRANVDPVVIGLVNNMPDTALRATELQFGDLIAAAAGGRPVRLELYALPEVARSAHALAHIRESYQPIGELYARGVDGLIVTGTQPRCQDLADEPYWPSFVKLIDWARENTRSTIWSCLAAHAALRHLDGIGRRPYAEKLSGVFSCMTAPLHEFAAGFPASWAVPHSRYNGLPEDELWSAGYHIISRSDEVGADLFVKQLGSLFVFFQGHPEYDRGALMREYRADIVKFLKSERLSYPAVPQNYFDPEVTAALAAFRRRAELTRATYLLASLPYAIAETKLTNRWSGAAVGVYRRWFDYLSERKARRLPGAESSGGLRGGQIADAALRGL